MTCHDIYDLAWCKTIDDVDDIDAFTKFELTPVLTHAAHQLPLSNLITCIHTFSYSYNIVNAIHNPTASVLDGGPAKRGASPEVTLLKGVFLSLVLPMAF